MRLIAINDSSRGTGRRGSAFSAWAVTISLGEPDTGGDSRAPCRRARRTLADDGEPASSGNDEAVRHDEVTAENGGDVLRSADAALCEAMPVPPAEGARRHPPPWGSLTGIRRPAFSPADAVEPGADACVFCRRARRIGKAALVAEILNAAGVYTLRGRPLGRRICGNPFCRTRCLYCSFISVDLSKTNRWVDEYVEALLRSSRTAALLRELGRRCAPSMWAAAP